jgi:hypothetical protein
MQRQVTGKGKAPINIDKSRVAHKISERLAKELRYKPEGRGFDFRWDHWDFSLT